MSFGADWTCSCGWANLDVRPKCRNCGAANPDYSPVTRKPASSPAGGGVREVDWSYAFDSDTLRDRFGGSFMASEPDSNGNVSVLMSQGDARAIIAALSPSTSAAEPAVWIANCCHCGRVVDTRETTQGGDNFGCELTDGRWTCSPECWDAVVEPVAAPPAPAAVESAQGVKALDEIGALVDEYDPKNSDWYFRRTVIREVLARLRASLAAEKEG